MAADSKAVAVRGTAFHAPRRGVVECLEDVVIECDRAGAITALHTAHEPGRDALIARLRAAGRLHELQPGQYLLPGLVDLHLHAPQWPQLGKALDVPLEQWLFKYTFPLEARFADVAFARRVYAAMVDSLLANGTTTAMYFATVHRESSVALAEICADKGQRGLVGRVAMDDPEQSPDYYRDASAVESIAQTRAFIADVRALPSNSGLVLPVITPRFVPTCSDEALVGLGRLARETGCHVQTHCSESDWEHGFVRDRTGRSDAQVLADAGLLTRRSILAHGMMMDTNDLALLAAAGAGIAHCPLSNIYFSHAVLPVRRALDAGVRIGLGTDVSGGASPSLFDACRSAIAVSRLLEDGVDPARPAAERGRPDSRIDFREAFWLATAGGGEALDLPVGQFAPGFAFDAMVIDANAPGSDLCVWPGLDDRDDVLQKIINLALRTNIAIVWVGGRAVAGTHSH